MGKDIVQALQGNDSIKHVSYEFNMVTLVLNDGTRVVFEAEGPPGVKLLASVEVKHSFVQDFTE